MNVNSFSGLQNLILKIMKNYAFFIGIDISKETLDFALIIRMLSNSIFKLPMTNWVLSCSSSKLENMISLFLLKTVFSAWSILAYIATLCWTICTQKRLTPGLNKQLKSKPVWVFLVRKTIRFIRKKLDFTLIKIGKMSNCGHLLVHRIFACVSRREKYNENYMQTFAWIIEIGPNTFWMKS